MPRFGLPAVAHLYPLGMLGRSMTKHSQTLIRGSAEIQGQCDTAGGICMGRLRTSPIIGRSHVAQVPRQRWHRLASRIDPALDSVWPEYASGWRSGETGDTDGGMPNTAVEATALSRSVELPIVSSITVMLSHARLPGLCLTLVR
jgi:hypothetical protein